jgi:hypothetical protein
MVFADFFGFIIEYSLKRDAVQILVNHVLKSLPYKKSHAKTAAFALVRLVVKAGDGA